MNVRETLLLRVARTRERNCATSVESVQQPVQLDRNSEGVFIGETDENCATASATALESSSCTSVAHEQFTEPPGFEGTGWRLAGAEGLSTETLSKFFQASRALDRATSS